MVRWINDYIGTAAWKDVAHSNDLHLLDVRNLVDKSGNKLTEVRDKISEGLKLLRTKEKIVVCCDFGMSRSNSIAAGIIAKKESINFFDAVNLVIEKTGEKEIKISMLDTVQTALGNDLLVNSNQGKTLVTGGSGFLGTHLYKILYGNDLGSRCIFVSSKEINLLNDGVALNFFCKKHHIQKIIHLANPKIYTTCISFGHTLVMLKNVLDVCIQNKLKLIYASSWEVYSGYKTTGLLLNENAKLNPGSTYGQSKMLCENLIKHYNEELNLKSVVLRISPIYGSGADKPKCIWNFAEKAKKNQNVDTHLYLNGLPTMDLLNIEDACQAILKAAQYEGDGIFNIGSGKAITTRELAETIIKLLNSDSLVKHTKLDLTTNNITLDITKTKRILDWEPNIPVKEGLIMLLENM